LDHSPKDPYDLLENQPPPFTKEDYISLDGHEIHKQTYMPLERRIGPESPKQRVLLPPRYLYSEVTPAIRRIEKDSLPPTYPRTPI